MSDETQNKGNGSDAGGAAAPENDAQAQPEQQQQQPGLAVQGQYIKDLSFEAPGTPGIFADLMRGAPEIPTSVDIRVNRMRDNLYEVTLHLQSESKIQGKTAFLAELQYAGLFSVNVPEEHLHPVLMIECPRLLFPFARGVLAALTREGGFPPLMLQPIDFVALYRQRMAQAAQQQEGEGGTQTA